MGELNFVAFLLVSQLFFTIAYSHWISERHCVSQFEELKKNDAVQMQMIHDLTEELRALKTNVEAKVAFTSVLTTPDLTSLGPGDTIVFDRVITNTGQAYDGQSGKFTAPLDGIVRPQESEYAKFAKNDQRVMVNYGTAMGAQAYLSSSRLLSVELTAGDKVWIRTLNESNHGNGVIHGAGFSSFSGWLTASTAL